MVVTRSQGEPAELEELRRAQEEGAHRELERQRQLNERERLRRLSMDPPASPTTRQSEVQEAAAATTEPRPGPSNIEARQRTRSPVHSVCSNRSTLSVTIRIRMAELEAAEKLAEIKRKELELEADLVKKRLAADVSVIQEEENTLNQPGTRDRVDEWLRTNPLTTRNENGQKEESRRLRFDTARERSPTPNKSRSGIDQLAEALEKMARPRLRHTELPTFSGNVNEWLPFKAAVRDTTKLYNVSHAENLQRLRSCLKGEARDAVSALLYTATDPEVIMKTLEQCFGRPEIIIDRAIDDLRKMPKPGATAAELNGFAIKLQNVICVLKNIDRRGYLHNPLLTREVLDKLSPHLKSRWCDYAYENEGTSDPEIVVLSSFLMQEADRALRYTYVPSPSATTTTAAKREVKPQASYKKKTNAVYTVDEVKEKQSKEKCPSCEQPHTLPQCPNYKALTIDQRWDLIKNKRICFKCIKGRHRRLRCKAKPCGVNQCRHPHHSTLHQEGRTEADEQKPTEAVLSVANTVTSRHENVLLKMCPVIIIGPRGEVDTYALLDEGATITLIDEQLANDIGAEGPSQTLRLQGVNMTQNEAGSKLVNVAVRGRKEERQYELRARTVKNLRLHQQSIPKTIMKYEHLQDLQEDEICYELARPGILIGADHWECIVSRELRVGEPNQPAASRTQLGWVVHGTVPSSVIIKNKRTLHIYEPKNEMEQSDHNTADDATRFCYSTISSEDRWFKGPTFLYEPEEDWPAERIHEETEEVEVLHTVKETEESWLPKPERFSKYETLIRATARVFAFIDICRRKATHLENRHIEAAEFELLRQAQKESFAEELKRMEAGRPLTRSSRLYKLDPVQEGGLLRVRGRIDAAAATTDVKQPIILDGRHQLTKLLVLREHCAAGHANRERVTDDLRQRYWVIHLRPTVRAVQRNCASCRVRRSKPHPPAMGDLLKARLDPFHRPFSNFGVDYFGPMIVKIGRRRKKRWGALGLPTTGPCEVDHKKSWRASQALADHFWKRWLREYLPTLVPRGEPTSHKRPLQEGDIVVVVDHTLPRNVWPMGIIQKTHPGPDRGIRVAEVKTRTGVFKRPVSKLVVLENMEASRAAPGGEMLRTPIT